MMNEETHDLSEENQNFMWRLEGILHEDHVFFLKVNCSNLLDKSSRTTGTKLLDKSGIIYFSRSPGRPGGAAGFSSSR